MMRVQSVMAALVLLVSNCALSPAQARTKANQSSPDVFLITIDTLRADHVEAYGYKQIKTPALNRLASDGIRFDNAFTPSPITNTSHASILTGLLPSSHGVADFAVPLAPNAHTIAEAFRQYGYNTAAFISAVILDSKALAPGFDRGFEYYFNFPANIPANTPRYGRVERRAEATIREAERWLLAKRGAQRPVFVWLHLYDPHDPYDPPPPFAQQYRSRPYDGEIAYADSQLLKFLNFLEQRGVYQRSLIIAVGDHGEGLGEHGEDTHGIFLYDSTLHVPLIVKLPGHRAAGTTVANQVRTTDIVPTMLEATGLQASAKLDGESLLPLIGRSASSERVALGETDYPLRFGWSPLKSARGGGYKYIEAPRPELYNLHFDPGETKNAYEPWSPQVQKLRGLIAELRERTGAKGSKNPAVPDPNTIEELKALGYLGNNPGATSATGPSLLPDPKDKIELHNLLHTAMLADEDGDRQRAQAGLNTALAKDPNSPVALLELGQLELELGNYMAAVEHLGRARLGRPEDSAAALYHGKALYGAGQWKQAQDALDTSLKLSPGQFEARYLLGKTYAKLKNWSAAQDQLEAAIFLDHKKPEARVELAQVLLAQNRGQQAVEQLAQAGKLTPDDPEIFELLAQAYTAAGMRQRAAEAAQRAQALRDKKQGARSGASTNPH